MRRVIETTLGDAMQHRWIVALGMVGLVAAVAGAAPPRAPRGTVVRAAIGERLDQAVLRIGGEPFWGTVVVAHGDDVLLAKGYGMADLADRVMEPRMLFDIGSVSKPITACAVMKLEEMKKLALDDSIAKHLDGVPPDKHDITVRHLLGHTSGLPPQIDFPADAIADRDRMVKHVLAQRSASAPGAEFAYNNAGYFVLAALIERVSGKSFEAFLRQAIFKPAWMADTGFVQDGSLDARLLTARVYEQDGRPMQSDARQYAWNWGNRGATGVVTSALDLLAWHRALVAGKVLKDPQRARFLGGVEPVGPRHYGIGWSIGESSRGTRRLRHGGDTRGYHVHLTLYPDDDAFVSVNTNVAELPAELDGALCSLLEGHLAGVDPEALAAHAGVYRLPNADEFEVTVEGGALVVRGFGAEAVSRVFYGEAELPGYPGWLAGVCRRAADLIRPLADGDVDRFVRGFAAGAAAGRDAARAALAAAVEAHGRITAARLIGTNSGRRVDTLVHVTFGDTPTAWRIEWSDDQGLAAFVREPDLWRYQLALAPASRSEFRATCLTAAHSVTVTFDGRSLHWLDGTDDAGIRCQKVR